jgi:hypothetical protein
MPSGYAPGTPVVYLKTKRSTTPGPRAENVQPMPHGEEYLYVVDKFWVVAEVRDDGQLVLQTRRGKQHVVGPDDPHLRPMRWWEKWFWREKIPSLSPQTDSSDESEASGDQP